MQLDLFGQEAPDRPRPQPRPAVPNSAANGEAKSNVEQIRPKRIAAASRNCHICGFPIKIPGLDADLCSNPERTCGSSGWVIDLHYHVIQGTKHNGHKQNK